MLAVLDVFVHEALRNEFSNNHVHRKGRIKYLKAIMLVKSFE